MGIGRTNIGGNTYKEVVIVDEIFNPNVTTNYSDYSKNFTIPQTGWYLLELVIASGSPSTSTLTAKFTATTILPDSPNNPQSLTLQSSNRGTASITPYSRVKGMLYLKAGDTVTATGTATGSGTVYAWNDKSVNGVSVKRIEKLDS